MEQFSCKGRVAVITGSSRAMGLEYVKALASAGAFIAALDSTPIPEETLEGIRKSYPVRIQSYVVDVTSSSSVLETVRKVEEDFGSIDFCITAHATATMATFLEQDIKVAEVEMELNYKGAYLISQACARVMARQSTENGSAVDSARGSIVFTSSSTTHMISHGQNLASYAASKAAIRGLVKPVAMELSQYGIRVNSISPGPIMTDVMRDIQRGNPALIKQFEAESMFGRIGMPSELHGVVLLLCSPAGSWITGQDVLVDGGASCWKHPIARLE